MASWALVGHQYWQCCLSEYVVCDTAEEIFSKLAVLVGPHYKQTCVHFLAVFQDCLSYWSGTLEFYPLGV